MSSTLYNMIMPRALSHNNAQGIITQQCLFQIFNEINTKERALSTNSLLWEMIFPLTLHAKALIPEIVYLSLCLSITRIFFRKFSELLPLHHIGVNIPFFCGSLLIFYHKFHNHLLLCPSPIKSLYTPPPPPPLLFFFKFFFFLLLQKKKGKS